MCIVTDKLRHIKHFKILFEQNSVQTRQHQTGSFQESPPMETREKTNEEDEEAKQGNCLLGYGLCRYVIWEILFGCL